MNQFNSTGNFLCVSIFALTLMFYPSLSQADKAKSEVEMEIQKETQMENIDYLSLEDEFLSTSTDDALAQEKEAREEAKLAKKEEQEAVVRLKKTKTKRNQVVESTSRKIARDLAVRREAIKNRDSYNAKTKAAEKEIAELEKKIQKTMAETAAILEEARKAREHYQQIRQKRAEMRDLEKEVKAEKRRAQRKLEASGGKKVVQR